MSHFPNSNKFFFKIANVEYFWFWNFAHYFRWKIICLQTNSILNFLNIHFFLLLKSYKYLQTMTSFAKLVAILWCYFILFPLRLKLIKNWQLRYRLSFSWTNKKKLKIILEGINQWEQGTRSQPMREHNCYLMIKQLISGFKITCFSNFLVLYKLYV